MTSEHSILGELEQALLQGDSEQRAQTLRGVTDLFVLGAGQYTAEQVALFDDVFSRLVLEIESTSRAVLSRRIAPLPAAPPRVIRTLAFDDEIDVAGPVLSYSEKLDEAALVENARTKSQDHLLAISRRRSLGENVTDILVERGNREVVQATAENPGARFSEAGYGRLVLRAADDERLAACVGLRPDIPRHHFMQLLSKASQAVRTKLEAANPQRSGDIRHAVAEIASRIQSKAGAHTHDYAAAMATVSNLVATNSLNAQAVEGFAKSGLFEETTAALAVMCDLPTLVVERAMAHDGIDPMLILCKAAGLPWASAKLVLRLAAGGRQISTQEFERSLASFNKLTPATAKYVVRFQRARAQGGDPDAHEPTALKIPA
jgi:uncharacterized protein (DUF2336 family)